jgi:hypothetical protein
MIFHHAAAVALVGWALIFPPMAADIGAGTKVDIGAPVNEWEVVRKGFATARDCEQFRAHGQITNFYQVGDPRTTALVLAAPERRAEGRCMPDDDPRLKGN